MLSKVSRRRAEIGRAWQALDLEDTKNRRQQFLFETEAALQSEAQRLEDTKSPAPLPLLASLLKRCGIARALSAGHRIHAHISHFHGPQPGPDLINPLIHMYGKCGDTESARRLFDSVHPKSIFTWNLMLAAYSQNSEPDQTLELFCRIDTAPNAVTYSTAVAACTIAADLVAGRKIHARIVASGVEIDPVLGTSLINMYGKCRSVQDASDLFESMTEPRCAVAWNTLLAIFVQNDRCADALRLFQRMEQPDAISYTSAVRACAGMRDLHEGRRIHTQLLASGVAWDVVLGNELIRMYAAGGSVEEAKGVFDSMKGRNSVSWTTLATAYTHLGHPRRAMELFWISNLEGVKPHRFIFPAFISACGTLSEGRSIHSCVRSAGVDSETAIANALVAMYGRLGQPDEGMRVFERTPERNVISWTALMAANAHCGDFLEALRVFRAMDVPPNEITLLTILDSCAGNGTLTEGRAIHASIRGTDLERDLRVGNALLNMYGRCGSFKEAREVFDTMKERNVVSWTCFIAANAREGRVVEVYWELEQDGVEVDGVVFVSVLTALSHAGLVEDCRRCFEGMLGRDGVVVGAEHYNCVVDLLGRVGWIDDAWDLLRSMPFEPPYEAWVAVLSCCNIHEEWHLGVQALT